MFCSASLQEYPPRQSAERPVAAGFVCPESVTYKTASTPPGRLVQKETAPMRIGAVVIIVMYLTPWTSFHQHHFLGFAEVSGIEAIEIDTGSDRLSFLICGIPGDSHGTDSGRAGIALDNLTADVDYAERPSGRCRQREVDGDRKSVV